jgi:hypothetical protein
MYYNTQEKAKKSVQVVSSQGVRPLVVVELNGPHSVTLVASLKNQR